MKDDSEQVQQRTDQWTIASFCRPREHSRSSHECLSTTRLTAWRTTGLDRQLTTRRRGWRAAVVSRWVSAIRPI